MADMTLTKMTAAEFSQLPESNKIIELINGEVVMAPSPTAKHQGVSGDLYFNLRTLLPSGGKWLDAPSDVYIDDLHVVQPDIYWISDENTNCRVIDNYWHGAPDFVIEILSPGTTRQDRKTKYELYEKHGVREYWIVDAEELFIEVYELHEGKFERLGAFGLGESFVSPVLNGLALSINALLKT